MADVVTYLKSVQLFGTPGSPDAYWELVCVYDASQTQTWPPSNVAITPLELTLRLNPTAYAALAPVAGSRYTWTVTAGP